MFCKNCGKEIIGTPDICPSCGIKPLEGHSYCPSCGSPITPSTERCVQCGARVRGTSSSGSKNKIVSILLAVFLGYWTWIYTYKKDGWKFWTVLGVFVITSLLSYFLTRVNPGFAALSPIFWFGSWIWPILDVVLKNDEWYINYHSV
jgi:hypothetical protein